MKRPTCLQPTVVACTLLMLPATRRELRLLPKAHLHLHLEGAMRHTTLAELCALRGVAVPPDTRGERFESFGSFASTYKAACECLQTEADLRRLMYEVVEDAKVDGASWVELAPSLPVYDARFGGTAATLQLLLDFAEEIEAEVSSLRLTSKPPVACDVLLVMSTSVLTGCLWAQLGVGIGLVISGTRDAPPADAERLAAIARAAAEAEVARGVRPHALVGFGLHADEGGHPPEPFARAFEIACGGGSPLTAMPHAGEIAPAPGGGPESVRFCVEELGARRIMHGVLAAEDDALVARLAALGVCCDVCPTSNYLLSVVESLSSHPLPQLLAAGVKCSINADDPLLFGCGLLSEFEVCRTELGMSDAALAACARTSFEHGRCPDALRQRGLDGIAAWLRGAAL